MLQKVYKDYYSNVPFGADETHLRFLLTILQTEKEEIEKEILDTRNLVYCENENKKDSMAVHFARLYERLITVRSFIAIIENMMR